MVLVGIELIFSVAAHMMLCFGFVLESADNTLMFSIAAEPCLHRAQDVSALHAALPARRLGVHQELGGDIARTAGPGWPKTCSTSHNMLQNKNWEKERGRDAQNNGVCLPKKPLRLMSPTSLEVT